MGAGGRLAGLVWKLGDGLFGGMVVGGAGGIAGGIPRLGDGGRITGSGRGCPRPGKGPNPGG